MPGLNRRRSSRALQHQSAFEDRPHLIHEHGKRPYPSPSDLKHDRANHSDGHSTCLPTFLKGANAALTKLPKVKKEIQDSMLPFEWTASTSASPATSPSMAANASLPATSPSGPTSHPAPPARKGKHPRRPPEAQMHHFPRQSCDECHNHKVKCVKVPNGPCERCSGLGIDCKFSLPKKYGRPSKAAAMANAQSSGTSRSAQARRQVKSEAQLAAPAPGSRSPVGSDHGAQASSPESTHSSAKSPDSRASFSSAVVSMSDFAHLTATATSPADPYPFSIEAPTVVESQMRVSTPSSMYESAPSSVHEDVFRAPSPPTIGQQSFRNIRERAGSFGSDSNSYSESSSSAASAGPSRASSMDGQLGAAVEHQVRMSSAALTSSPYITGATMAFADARSNSSSTSSPVMGNHLFTSSPWQQSALASSSWDASTSAVSSGVLAFAGTLSSSPFAALDGMGAASGGVSEMQHSIAAVEFENLMNTFDASMFMPFGSVSSSVDGGGGSSSSGANVGLSSAGGVSGDVEGASSLGLGLLSDFSSAGLTPSLTADDTHPTSTSLAQRQRQDRHPVGARRSGGGDDDTSSGSQQDSSPDTPAASRPSLTSVSTTTLPGVQEVPVHVPVSVQGHVQGQGQVPTSSAEARLGRVGTSAIAATLGAEEDEAIAGGESAWGWPWTVLPSTSTSLAGSTYASSSFPAAGSHTGTDTAQMQMQMQHAALASLGGLGLITSARTSSSSSTGTGASTTTSSATTPGSTAASASVSTSGPAVGGASSSSTSYSAGGTVSSPPQPQPQSQSQSQPQEGSSGATTTATYEAAQQQGWNQVYAAYLAAAAAAAASASAASGSAQADASKGGAAYRP